MPPKKKQRWTTAQKNAAAKKKAASQRGPKRPHRGQGPAGDAPRTKDRWRERDGAPSGGRPQRVRSDGIEDRGQRAPGRRSEDNRGGYERRPRREDERGGDRRREDSRGGYERRPRRDDDRRRPTQRFEREQARRPVEPVEDPEALRMEADTWTKSSRTSLTGPVDVAEDNGFAALGLPSVLVERMARDGITTPFAIQEAAIPDALAGKDVLGRGQTGSGKTLAFGLPLLARLAGGRARSRRPRALVLVPTRELAMQVSDSLEPLVHVMGLRHKLVAGGLSYTGQTAALDRGVDVLVATPGRLVDLLDRGALTLDQVEVAVLDEADHMADMGFLPSVTRILDECAPGGQRLLFSATLDRGVGDLVDAYMVDPVTHNTNDVAASVDTMEHHLLLIDPQHKKTITARVASRPGRTVIFARTKLGCERIAGQLREEGVPAAALHGGLAQNVRNKVIGAFRTGAIPVLVATDVAARGIHVDNVSLVMQVDPPGDHKDYLHRAGRTARAGEKGSVVTLVLPHQRREVTRMASAAGLEARPTKVGPEDQVLVDIGASEPSGEPIPEADFRKLVDPRPARRHSGTKGPRGARSHRGDDRRRHGGGHQRRGGGQGRRGAQGA
ncbi:DEAD/DEAH box helicase [Janibacter sp. DB-40]|uniref:DEAD/DEAH box helicase n=1 Tax=Janibacter sp. DB-40 TaxID=3028808 RepID=UPI00240626EE|nr:DEAD/DEAH box helicase [Janibacter sp. DB-40]